MILADVNVLVYAHRSDATDHSRYHDWLEETLAGDVAVAVSESILAGFLRVATHPRVFVDPTPLEDAFAFADAVRSAPNGVPIAAGQRHWGIFERLCAAVGARGNLIPDAYLAALAIENGCDWVTTDRDFSRFPGLRWRHPLAG